MGQSEERASAGIEVADRVGRSRGRLERRGGRPAESGSGNGRKWRNRFAVERLDGLLDEPRPGRPRTTPDEQVEAVITKTLKSTAREATHLSTRSMPSESGLTHSAVSRIWRAFGLQPHRQDWKLSEDPQFVDKVKDVVGLYLAPPGRAVVLSRLQVPCRLSSCVARFGDPGSIGSVGVVRSSAWTCDFPSTQCRAGHHHRQGDRSPARATSSDRVQEALDHHRP